jgi:tRNA-specific 2-thiouridylase
MTGSRPPKVVVAMSGGVDSSVTAALLKQRGYDVVGCFMRLGSEHEEEAAAGYDNMADQHCDPTQASGRTDRAGASDDDDDLFAPDENPKNHKKGCCSVNDATDARHVAAMLGIPFYVLNFKKDFGKIIDYFVEEYNSGRTPNPCVRCNDWLKFGKLYEYADSIDADYVASGHYARIEYPDSTPGASTDSPNPGASTASPKPGASTLRDPAPSNTHPPRPQLKRGVDASKDQSYVLFGAPRHRLDHMLLPVGEFTKDRVRDLAREFDLPVFDKPDSQEICFVPDNDYTKLVRRRTPEKVAEGQIVDTAGHALGTHPGQQHFTIGQRRGLNLAMGYPIYVTHKDPETNTVVVGQKDELQSTGCIASQINWLEGDPPSDWLRCEAKVRYNSEPVPAAVRVTGEQMEVHFDDPITAVTPGQAVVCYDDDLVLGGGWIDEAL